MTKGIIVKRTSRYWIVMTREGQFKKVRRQTDNSAIGEEIQIAEPVPRRRTALFASAAAALVALIALVSWQIGSLYTPTSEVGVYVAVDINPSVELGLNSNGEILTSIGLNEDGERLLGSFEPKGMSLEVAVRELIRRADEEQYLAPYLEKGSINIVVSNTIVSDDQNTSDFPYTSIIEQNIADMLLELHPDSPSVTIRTFMTPSQMRDEAVRQGVSTGKIALKLLAEDRGQQIDWNDLRQLSVDEIAEQSGGWDSLVASDQTASNERLQELFEEYRQTASQTDAEVDEASSNSAPSDDEADGVSDEFVRTPSSKPNHEGEKIRGRGLLNFMESRFRGQGRSDDDGSDRLRNVGRPNIDVDRLRDRGRPDEDGGDGSRGIGRPDHEDDRSRGRGRSDEDGGDRLRGIGRPDHEDDRSRGRGRSDEDGGDGSRGIGRPDHEDDRSHGRGR